MTDIDLDSDYVSFGDVARKQLNQQCQYASRYVDGRHDNPNLGEGLRITGTPSDYHGLKIHKYDVDEFVRRVKQHRADMGLER